VGVTTTSKPLEQIIMMSQSETMSSSSLIIFVTLFSAGLPAAATMRAIMQSQNYFPQPNRHNLDHILSTTSVDQM
jgi:hypothetical protein